MTYTLTVSSQGQIVIPSQVRKYLGITPKSKIKLRLMPKAPVPSAVIEPENINWVDRVAGTAKGIYGDVDKYIEHERASWDRSNPWP